MARNRTLRPISELVQWVRINDGAFHDVKPAAASEPKGSGLIATRDLDGDIDHGPLLVVPRDLVISKETVAQLALSDRNLRELLEALKEFVQNSRGSILTFLLYCLTVNNARENGYHLGSLTPFNQYITFLPNELLPTFWTPAELSLLAGTSLAAAIESKLSSLQREFSTLCDRTKDIRWCQDLWFPSYGSGLVLEDWKVVDSMYRSRALEFPGIGDAMVPCIDVANHCSGDGTSAIYETDSDGNAILLLRPGIKVKEGKEVTITYGDAKGACEMLFSYGFIEETMTNARELFLPLSIADDDPLGAVKSHVAKEGGLAPGVKLFFDEQKQAWNWFSEYVYLMILNQEDGLDFAVSQTTDGHRELVMSWHGDLIEVSPTSLAAFVEKLQKDQWWQVWHLRAAVTVLNKIIEQLEVLDGLDVEALLKEAEDDLEIVREIIKDVVMKLRELEGKAMRDTVAVLEKCIEELSEHETVLRWFAMQEQAREEEQAEEHTEQERQENEDFT